MYFFGKYNHQMDAKGRLRIPCKLKSALGSDFIVSRGVGGCLFIFAPDKIEEIQHKLASIPFGDKQNQKTARTFFASIDQPEEDNQGRFILDPSLRKFADIKKASCSWAWVTASSFGRRNAGTNTTTSTILKRLTKRLSIWKNTEYKNGIQALAGYAFGVYRRT